MTTCRCLQMVGSPPPVVAGAGRVPARSIRRSPRQSVRLRAISGWSRTGFSGAVATPDRSRSGLPALAVQDPASDPREIQQLFTWKGNPAPCIARTSVGKGATCMRPGAGTCRNPICFQYRTGRRTIRKTQAEVHPKRPAMLLTGLPATRFHVAPTTMSRISARLRNVLDSSSISVCSRPPIGGKIFWEDPVDSVTAMV